MNEKELILKMDAVPDTADKRELKKELQNILSGMKKVSEGFLQIAQAANRMKDKRLYRYLGFDTFDMFCNKIIGLTRKQVYLYIRIAEITGQYNDLFDERFVISMGPAKMDEVCKGLDKIENSSLRKKEKRKKIEELVSKIDPCLTVAETEKIVKEFVKYL